MQTAIACYSPEELEKIDQILYHPLEYLLGSKILVAYLDRGFKKLGYAEEGQAILIGHVVKFLQERNGDVATLERFDRYKSEYSAGIFKMFLSRGISLHNVEQIVVSNEKLYNISTSGYQHKPSDREFTDSNVTMSSNYDQFKFLGFNRKTSRKHINTLKKLIQKYGVISYAVVVETDCITGKMEKYIADGQHRYTAEKELGIPFYYTVTRVKTKEELVELIAALNTSQRKWNIGQYLYAWTSLEIPAYERLTERYKMTRLQMSVLIEAYMGIDRRRAAQNFVSGKFDIYDTEKAEAHIRYLAEFRDEKLALSSRSFNTALLGFFKKEGDDYDHELMKARMREVRNTYQFSFDELELVDQLSEIYRMAA
ncbi:MAG: hypothetical protein JWM20_653 [Patescibacteria group bacterium]|nr:hypothetical protein [Patescibacteria group bacterium]